MLTILIQIFTITALLLFTWIQFRRKKLNFLAENGIKSEPVDNLLWGNLQTMMNRNMPIIGEWHSKYGRIFGYYLGIKPKVVVTDLEILSRIQIKESNNFIAKTIFNVKGGIELYPHYEKSLISDTISDLRWKEQRSLLSTAFSSAKLKSSVPLIDDAIITMMKLLEENRLKSKDGEVEIYKIFQGLTMDTIGRSAFGVETNAQEKPDDPFFVSVRRVFESHMDKLYALPFMADLLLSEFTLLWYPIRRIQWIFMRFLGMSDTEYQVKIISNILQQRKKNAESLERNKFARNDLLQQMIEANFEENKTVANQEGTGLRVHRMKTNEIVSNSMLFFDAGYETTSTLLGFLAHVLVSHENIQEAVRKEIVDLYEKDHVLEYNTLAGLPYLDAVINETLRYYPPITMFVTRKGKVDLVHGKIRIPKGVPILVPVYLLHHDPDYWNEPQLFDPERWLGERKKEIKPLAFQPFGAGPRICIGMRFALLEAKMAIANILLKYQLKPGHKTQLGNKLQIEYKPISMVPKDGVHVRLIPINN